ENVVIYLTPYIVRESGDLQKLKMMLSELEEVQGRYNNLVRKELEEKTGISVEEANVPASRRIKQTPHQRNLSILNGEGA
ncbi:MAG: type II secretion system protein GspD, partial [Sulfurovum sp.]|nr:type II secretion system protein GspD [Sulfurovum sp.]NNJ45494.1 type II secretion system protein GspD [Sulfurovum sp.]